LNAEKVLREMKEAGLTPDAVTYTTVIDAYKREKNIDKCWELYEYYSTVECDRNPPDEFMLSFMIRICSATHDAEKAIRIFSELELNGYIQHCLPYNSIIFALGSTQRYA
jgi:pentatricopeptide repeat protein